MKDEELSTTIKSAENDATMNTIDTSGYIFFFNLCLGHPGSHSVQRSQYLCIILHVSFLNPVITDLLSSSQPISLYVLWNIDGEQLSSLSYD